MVYENNSENIIQDKSKQDSINLILLKYENKIEFENELNALENLSTNYKKLFEFFFNLTLIKFSISIWNWFSKKKWPL